MSICLLVQSEQYGKRLADYISRREDSPFKVSLFLEHPFDGEELEHADLIVVEDGLKAIYEEKIRRDEWAVLDEQGFHLSQSRHIYKYQSAAVIYQKLLEICIDQGCQYIGDDSGRPVKMMIAGIYMPVRYEDSLKEVIHFCKQKYDHIKWCYMNMSCTPEKELSVSDNQWSLSDWIYYVKQKHPHTAIHVREMIERLEMDYLKPAEIFWEIDDLTEEDWQFGFSIFQNDLKYAWLVLDFGQSMPGLSLLTQCDYLFCLYHDTPWEREQVSYVQQMIRRMDDIVQSIAIEEHIVD